MLHGVFLGSSSEVRWLYDEGGASRFYPPQWAEFVGHLAASADAIAERVPPEASAAAEDSGTRPASPGVVDQLASMRHNLDRRRESLQLEDEKLGEEWSGLAEL